MVHLGSCLLMFLTFTDRNPLGPLIGVKLGRAKLLAPAKAGEAQEGRYALRQAGLLESTFPCLNYPRVGNLRHPLSPGHVG